MNKYIFPEIILSILCCSFVWRNDLSYQGKPHLSVIDTSIESNLISQLVTDVSLEIRLRADLTEIVSMEYSACGCSLLCVAMATVISHVCTSASLLGEPRTP